MLGVPTAARATGFVVDGAQYLLGIQDSGGFFADASPTSFYASTQGQIGLGMLSAYLKSCEVSCNAAYLNSAVALGDAMLDPINHATVINPTHEQRALAQMIGSVLPAPRAARAATGARCEPTPHPSAM